MLHLLKKRHQNIYLFILIIFLVILLCSSFLFFEFQKFEREILLAQASMLFIKMPQQVTLMFVGDIMLDRGVEWSVNQYGKGDWKFPFLKIIDGLNEADILFGNLESPISDKGVKVGSIYSFRATPKAITGLTFAGFDILSVANNHIFDYGRLAMEDNFKRLKLAGIAYVGGGFNEIEAHSPVIKNLRGTKLAFLAYNNLGSKHWAAKGDNSGIGWLEEEKLAEDIKEAKEKADIVVVSMHFGDEYQPKPNSEQKTFAHLAIDSGADLVVGHHPHVVQGIENYKGKYIAYSLGNFVFDQGFSKETMEGLLLKVVVEDAKIKEVIPIDIKINQYFQPRLEIRP